MKTPKPDDAVSYWSEPRTKGAPPGGPYPARVARVLEDGRLDLEVTVAPSTVRTKTGVPFVASPAKHCCTWPARQD